MTPKDVIAQAEKEFSDKFIFIPPPEPHESGGTLLMPYEIRGSTADIKRFIFSTYTKDLLRSVVELSDKIESEHEHTEFNEWRAFKGFRNTVRDIIKELNK